MERGSAPAGVPPSSDALTTCPACQRATKTIAGRCPNCGAPKDPAAVPAPRRLRGGSFFDSLDDFLITLAIVAPVTAVAVALVFVVLLDAPLVLAAGAWVLLVAALLNLLGVGP